MSERQYVRTPRRIDVKTNPAFDEEMKNLVAGGADEIAVDMTDTVYISSAGLRTLLSATKALRKKSGTVRVLNVAPQVMEVFDITGYSGFLTIGED